MTTKAPPETSGGALLQLNTSPPTVTPPSSTDATDNTLTDATVQGVLDLRDAALAVALTFKGCHFQDELRLNGLQGRSLVFLDCEIPNGLSLADGRIREAVRLEGCAFGESAIDVSGLATQYLTVTKCGCESFDARGVQISRALSLKQLAVVPEIIGAVNLEDARISGPVHVIDKCILGGPLLMQGSTAKYVWIHDSSVHGSVMHPAVDLDRAEIVGEVDIRSSVVVGGISLRNGHFGGVALEGKLHGRGARYAALDGRGSQIDGSVELGHRLGGLEVSGPVNFTSAHVRGSFIVGQDAVVAPPEGELGMAIWCDRASIDGDLKVYSGWTPEGSPPIPGMSLFGCEIGGGVDIGRRINGDGLLLDGAKISQSFTVDRGATSLRAVDLRAESVHLDGLFAAGEPGPDIGDVLLLDGAEIQKPLEVAGSLSGGMRMVDVSAVSLRVSTEMRQVDALANLAGVHAQALDITDFRGCSELILERIRVDDLDLLGLEATPMRLDLRGAGLGTLSIGSTKGKPLSLDLDGAQTIAILPGPAEVPVNDRLELLTPDPTKHSPGAFLMLAGVYRRSGHPRAATETLIENERRQRSGGSAMARAWSWLQQHVTGYGYQPSRAFRWLLAFWVLGSLILLPMRSQFVGTKGSPALVPFRPELYLLDQWLPFLSTGQEKYTATGAAMWTVPALVVLGWVLFSTVAAGLASATRRGD
jgi:hypothetical protein